MGKSVPRTHYHRVVSQAPLAQCMYEKRRPALAATEDTLPQGMTDYGRDFVGSRNKQQCRGTLCGLAELQQHSIGRIWQVGAIGVQWETISSVMATQRPRMSFGLASGLEHSDSAITTPSWNHRRILADCFNDF